MRFLRLLKLKGILRSGFQIGNGRGVAGECRDLFRYAVGVVADRPDPGVGAVQRQVQLDLRDRDRCGAEAQNVRLGNRCHAEGVVAGQVLTVCRIDAYGVFRAGIQLIENDVLPLHEARAGEISVGVGAGDVKGAAFFLCVDADGDGVGLARNEGDAVNVDGGGLIEEIVPAARANGEQEYGSHCNERPFLLRLAALLLPGRLFLLRCGLIVLLRLQRVEQRPLRGVRALVDRLNDGAEHIGVGREALLEVLRHVLRVGELYRLDLLLCFRRVDRLVIRHKRRHDQGVAQLVALHVIDKRLTEVLRRCVALLGLEGARLEDDLRHLIVGVHRRRKRLTGHAALVRRTRGGLLVLKRAVVAVEDAVEDEAGRVNVGRGVNGADQIEQLRCGIGAEHILRHRAVFQLVDLRDPEVTQYKVPLRAQINVRRLDVPVDKARRAQIDQRAAKVHPQIDRRELRHGVFAEIVGQRLAEFGQQIHVVSDGLLLRLDLIAAVAVEVGAARKCLERFQLLLIIRDDLLIIFLRLLGRGSRAGIDQRIDLSLGLRHGNMLENVSLAALCAPHDIHGRTAAGTQALHDLHVGKQR